MCNHDTVAEVLQSKFTTSATYVWYYISNLTRALKLQLLLLFPVESGKKSLVLSYLVFRLWLRGLEGAREDRHFAVRHLSGRRIFVGHFRKKNKNVHQGHKKSARSILDEEK